MVILWIFFGNNIFFNFLIFFFFFFFDWQWWATIKQAPFINKTITKEIIKYLRLRNKFLNTKSELDRKMYDKKHNYCVTLIRKAKQTFFFDINAIDTQVLRRFKPCSQRVGDPWWWGSLTMVPAGNKAKRLSSVNNTTKTIIIMM